PPAALQFAITPGSTPPTNIHAIIGRNSVGKTKLLWDMTAILCSERTEPAHRSSGELAFESANEKFSRLVTVAFSAFDPFRAPSEGSVSEGDIFYSYIGLKKRGERGFDRGQGITTKSEEELSAEFANSLANCSNEPRLQRWKDALTILATDR